VYNTITCLILISTYYNYNSVYNQFTAHVTTDTQQELMVSGVGHPGWDITAFY